MSNTERKALKIIILLLGMADQGHFKIYTKEIKQLLDRLLMLYKTGIMSRGDETRLRTEILTADSRLADSNIISSVTMLLSTIMEISEEFMSMTKGFKHSAWSALHQYCNNHELIRHVQHKIIDVHYVNEFQKAEQIAEIIS